MERRSIGKHDGQGLLNLHKWEKEWSPRHKGLRDQPFPQPQHTHHGHPAGGGGAVHLSFMWMLWKQKQRGESPQIIAVVYSLSLVKKGSYGNDSTGLREKK